MELETAPSVDEAEEKECAVCDEEGTFVIYDGDKVCDNCGYAPAGGGSSVTADEDEWQAWLVHRDEEYSGFYGEDRIKFAGGFASAYDFGADFE